MTEAVLDPRVRWVPPVILALALGLRVWNIDAGVPYAVGSDEPQVVGRALRMMRTGDLHPHFFHYPSLYIYLQLVVAIVTFVAGATAGLYAGLLSFTGEDFYPVARTVTALFGVATVAVTMRIGLRFGTGVALAGGLLMAVMPMHVRESHYVLTDVPVTFFVALTLLAAFRAHEQPSLARFAIAGAAGGLAAATKYNGGLALLLPLTIIGIDAVRGRRVGLPLAATLGAAGAAYLVMAPYTVLDLPEFLDAFAGLNAEYHAGGAAEAPWLTYLKHLRINFGIAAVAAIVGGLTMTAFRAVRGPDRVLWLLLLVFPVVHFDMLAGRTLIFGRYLLPLLPMLCVIAGIGLVGLTELLARRLGPRTRAAVAVVATVAVLAVPVTLSVRFSHGLGMPSTRQAAYAWLVENAPKSTKLAIEFGALQLADDRYRIEAHRRVIDLSLDDHRTRGVRYLVTTSEVSRRHESAYREYFGHRAPVFVSAPSRRRTGPEVRIYDVTDQP